MFLTRFGTGTGTRDQATGIAHDAALDAFVSGTTTGDFGSGALGGGFDAFAAKIDALGNLQ